MKALANTGRFACYDMLMNTIPVVVLTVLGILLNTIMFVVGITSARQEMGIFFTSLILSCLNSYFFMYFLGLTVLITEWKKIRCSRGRKLKYSFTFPLFLFSFGLAMLAAVFGSAQWKPIKHTAALSIGDLSNPTQK